MSRFPVDVPKRKIVETFEMLGFETVREREHIAMSRRNTDGTFTPITLPDHPRKKARPCEGF